MEFLVLKTRIVTAFFVLPLFVVGAPIGGVQAAELSDREREDLFAYELFVDTWNIPHEKRDKEYAELRSYFWATGELSLITLDRSNSKEADRALAFITLLGLDASFSELHTCAVYKRGKRMHRPLADAKKAFEAGQCELPESKVKVARGRCGDAKSVNRSLRRLIDGVTNNVECDD